MSCFRWGDQISQLYSSNGRTYTVNARTRRFILRETKQRCIMLARWWALVTIPVMCWLKDKFWVAVIPKSRVKVTTGSGTSQIENRLTTSLPMQSIQHLSTDKANCQSSAHCTKAASALCRSSTATSLITFTYSLTSSANNFTLTP